MREVMEQAIRVIPGKVLTAADEQALFMQLNYARHQVTQVRRKLIASRSWRKSTVMKLLEWHERQAEAQSKIITANMGLVLAMSKRSAYSGVEFTDLVSEGSMALLRAAEKFDCSRGFKFSTYAWRAISKAFSRLIKQTHRYRSVFPAQLDPALEKDDRLDRRREEAYQDMVSEVRLIMQDNLANLTGIERSVVEMRFSLNQAKSAPLTLGKVGDQLGLTKERIRQIQNKALAKLREAAEKRMVAS